MKINFIFNGQKIRFSFKMFSGIAIILVDNSKMIKYNLDQNEM